jgi:hypothetical protein
MVLKQLISELDKKEGRSPLFISLSASLATSLVAWYSKKLTFFISLTVLLAASLALDSLCVHP